MKRFLLLLFILVKNMYLFAQGQYNNWHFGINSSLNFSLAAPVLTQGSQIISDEASASISDSLGNLLFYTNGNTVWSSNNTIMPNGTGLSGQSNVQQAALIVPWPDSSNLYYIFTIGNTIPGGKKQLSYSIVDMTLNGSLGDIATKNTLLDDNVTEKLTATKNNNGTDFWMVEKDSGSNQFKSFAITHNGINTDPVLSNANTTIQSSDLSGAIKISNNGCWLAATVRGINDDPGIVELFHFDNSTGIVSEGVGTNSVNHPYGVEFSPDNSKLYIGETGRKPVWQFNLIGGNEADAIASQMAVSDSFNNTYAFQQAPDGKIYFVTDDTSLAAIDNPGVFGISCNVSPGAVTGITFNTKSLPNNFNLTYKGILSCEEGQQCFEPPGLLMANAFTPNGDGINDCYGIKYKHEDSLHIIDFAIYDRWGKRMFYTTNPDDCWDGYYDGLKADQNNYVYYIRIRTPCGVAAAKGNLVLIR